MPTPTRAAIVTLGCGRNEVDSDQLAGLLLREGIEVVPEVDDAEVLLVNTCSFIAPAKQESIDTVLAACQRKDEGAARAVIVVGCLAQRYPDELADAIPEADAIVGFDGYPALPRLVGEVLAGPLPERVVGVGAAHPGARPARRDLPLIVAPTGPTAVVTADPTVAVITDPTTPGATDPTTAAPVGPATIAEPRVLDLAVIERTRPPVAADEPPAAPSHPGQDDLDRVPASGPRFPVRVHDGRPWAYLKIASGCDRVCTFCAIPSFRGRFRSRPLDEVVAEARWLAANGARELVLVSENTTSWGKDLPGGRGLQPQLLRALADIDEVERLRLMYLQPAELTTGLLEAMAAEPKVVPYFDLSLQHVSAPVLARMARSGDPERFGALIASIRELAPDAVFRSSFILGFPGETEADVDALAGFLAAHRLDWVGLFAFSREDGTPSADLPDQVPADLATERLERVRDLQEQLADDAARRFVGRDLEVLVESHLDVDGVATTLGRSYREAPDTDGEVEVVTAEGAAADLPVGRTVTARIVDTVGVDLVAQVTAATAGARPDHG